MSDVVKEEYLNSANPSPNGQVHQGWQRRKFELRPLALEHNGLLEKQTFRHGPAEWTGCETIPFMFATIERDVDDLCSPNDCTSRKEGLAEKWIASLLSIRVDRRHGGRRVDRHRAEVVSGPGPILYPLQVRRDGPCKWLAHRKAAIDNHPRASWKECVLLFGRRHRRNKAI